MPSNPFFFLLRMYSQSRNVPCDVFPRSSRNLVLVIAFFRDLSPCPPCFQHYRFTMRPMISSGPQLFILFCCLPSCRQRFFLTLFPFVDASTHPVERRSPPAYWFPTLFQRTLFPSFPLKKSLLRLCHDLRVPAHVLLALITFRDSSSLFFNSLTVPRDRTSRLRFFFVSPSTVPPPWKCVIALCVPPWVPFGSFAHYDISDLCRRVFGPAAHF